MALTPTIRPAIRPALHRFFTQNGNHNGQLTVMRIRVPHVCRACCRPCLHFPSAPESRLARHDPEGRLRRRARSAAGKIDRRHLRRSALQSSARWRSSPPGPVEGRCGRRRLGPVREFRSLRRLHARLAAGRAPGAQAERHHLGDRLVSQHLPRRRHDAGSRLLDPQRRRLAQDQPDAELPRPPLPERP